METKITKDSFKKAQLTNTVTGTSQKIDTETGNYEIIGYKADGKPLYAKRTPKHESSWKSKTDEQAWVADLWF